MLHEPTDPGDRLLTITEVAKILNVPTSTLRQWRARGDGPRGFKVVGNVRYYRRDVDAFIRQCRDAEPRDAA